MPTALPYIALALATTATVGQAVEANQATQHAKGAAEAQKTAMDEQLKEADADTAAAKKSQAQTAQSGAAQKMAAILAQMTSAGGVSGTNTGASNATPAPTSQKTLLGT